MLLCPFYMWFLWRASYQIVLCVSKPDWTVSLSVREFRIWWPSQPPRAERWQGFLLSDYFHAFRALEISGHQLPPWLPVQSSSCASGGGGGHRPLPSWSLWTCPAHGLQGLATQAEDPSLGQTLRKHRNIWDHRGHSNTKGMWNHGSLKAERILEGNGQCY